MYQALRHAKYLIRLSVTCWTGSPCGWPCTLSGDARTKEQLRLPRDAQGKYLEVFIDLDRSWPGRVMCSFHRQMECDEGDETDGIAILCIKSHLINAWLLFLDVFWSGFAGNNKRYPLLPSNFYVHQSTSDHLLHRDSLTKDNSSIESKDSWTILTTAGISWSSDYLTFPAAIEPLGG